MMTPDEVARTLVIRFDPVVLYQEGARSEQQPPMSVQGVHYFLCLTRVPGVSVWVPAFSRWVPGRIQLRWKGGESSWVCGESFIDQTQQWLVPDKALGPAAAGCDTTRRGRRNHASLFFLDGQHLRDDASRAA